MFLIYMLLGILKISPSGPPWPSSQTSCWPGGCVACLSCLLTTSMSAPSSSPPEFGYSEEEAIEKYGEEDIEVRQVFTAWA